MTEVSKGLLVPVTDEAVDDAWHRALTALLTDELSRATAGQCLRIGGLPRRLLERAVASLHAEGRENTLVGLVDQHTGPEPWRVGVHRIVEYRNSETAIVLAAIPPDVKLAAGDSVDISVFRDIPTQALGMVVELAFLLELSPQVREAAVGVLRDLARRGVAISESQRLLFLATVAHQPQELWVVGAAVGLLGLIPDYDLFEKPGEMAFRIGQRNWPCVDLLRGPGGTLMERVFRLPVTDPALRTRILELLEAHGGNLNEALPSIATEARWRGLSLDQWPFGDEVLLPGEIRIEVAPLNLPRRDDGLLVWDPGTKVIVRWSTTPPPADVPGLSAFRVELLTSDRVVVWESALIRRGSGKTAHRSRTIRDLHDLESGIHFFRVVAYTDTADPFPIAAAPAAGSGGKAANESEDFLLLEPGDVSDIPVVPTRAFFVADHTEAELTARMGALGTDRPLGSVLLTGASWEHTLEADHDATSATLRFDLRQFTVRISQLLRRFEVANLANGADAGRWRCDLRRREPDLERVPLALPEAFATARTEAFRAINQASGLDEGQPVVSVVDLSQAATEIEHCAHEYRAWLETGNPDALAVDTVSAETGDGAPAVLVAPTHPLRLLWQLQRQAVARSWAEASSRGAAGSVEVGQLFRGALNGFGLPALLVLGSTDGYVGTGVLPGGWGIYLRPGQRDSRTQLARLKSRLGLRTEQRSEIELPPSVLADKFDAYLRQHPYTSALVLNIVNPGDGRLVVDALIDLESRLMAAARPIRYEVRLFADDPSTNVVGEALRELMDPERQVSEAAARLAGPGKSFLFPKLTWSRHATSRFLEDPSKFQAHLTIILDAFPVTLRVARMDADDRSSFVHGLVQEAPRRFAGRGDAFAWIRRASPRPCEELSTAPGRSALLAGVIRDMASLQAEVLAPGSETTAITAVSSLDLSLPGQTLLYAAHSVSTWVLTVDSNLGVDYFDSASRQDRPGYLLDFTPEFVATGGRQVLLTTRAVDEVIRLVAPLTEQLDVDPGGSGPLLLLEALRSLSGRLAMRLMSSPSQVQGALGMALSRLFLEAHSLLDNAIVIPIDAHPELTVPTEEGASGLRGDLLVVSCDPAERIVDFMVIESKCHKGVGLPSELRTRITSQVTATANRLTELFEIRDDNDRVDRSIRTWQLTTVLSFYLERARRYGLIRSAAAEELQHFIADLDAGYRLNVRRSGLVFRLDDDETRRDDSDPDVPIWIIGSESISRLLNDAIRNFVVVSEQPSAPEEGVERPNVLATQTKEREPTWEAVRNTFTTRRRMPMGRMVKRAAEEGRHTPSAAETKTADEVEAEPGERDEPDQEVEAAPDEIVPPTEASESRIPSWDVLLGDVAVTPQAGTLAAVASEPWRSVALDLNGCNTVSVFGVQGGGKSYTLGSIIEMACREIPGINILPQPLGAVVFHYHQTQDYPPEFVSMVRPNSHEAEVAALRDLGAEPAALTDIVLLATPDTVARRRLDFPQVQVEPIGFSSQELTVADWRFLMGATGSDALYLRLVNEVMRQSRDNLTLDRIRDGIQHAALNDAQLRLASTRLDFASRFVDDQRSLRSLLAPGRLVVVDLRDEFVERDEALGLFVTMLNVFSGAGLGPERQFNKLIVFDEAHKYMGGSLIGQVVEVIREMRHKGVSVVIASQDPVNVPSAVIELSSAVVLHRFNSPNWLKHIQKSLTSLGELTPGAMNALQPGEAFVWANRATDPTFTRRAVKVRMRPRVTNHGGATRTAVDGE